MGPRAEFEAEHPEVHVLSADQAGRVDLVMGALGWLGDEEQVTTCRALGGDSSTVMRVELQELRGGWRTAVLKQALPWLRCDESVAMPDGRGSAELRFYRRVVGVPEAAANMPRLLGGDETRSVLLLEDFRGAADLTSIYGGGSLGEDAANALGAFLNALHVGTRDGRDDDRDDERDEAPAPAGMRMLNHRLVFEAPFVSSSASAGVGGFGPDGPALDTTALDEIEAGLGAAAAALRANRAFREAMTALGRRFLDAEGCLIHGAFHPGNWLLLPDGAVRVVDPQFGGWGDAEFDIGAGLAHLLLSQQPEEIVSTFLAASCGWPDGDEETAAGDSDAVTPGPAGGSGRHCDASPDEADTAVERESVARYAGAEMVRRLIGGGQLPLAMEAGSRRALLDVARTAVLDGRMEVLET